MSGIFEQLGIPTIVNAYGPATRLGGAVMPDAVIEAMVQASGRSMDMMELQARACSLIAEATGAEAGYVTSGAAAGLLLGTAACVVGLDPAAMDRLPDTRGMKSEVLVARSHRNAYDHSVRAAGVRLVEIGLPDRVSGAGVRDVEPWEYAAAVTEKTAALLYVAHAGALPPFPEVVRVAREAGVSVLVDAAAELPPVANLHSFIAAGADLVVFSGGKAIRGPQGSGVLCGRRHLVASAALQPLDLDIAPEQWELPEPLFAGVQLAGLPRHGIGRSCKVGPEAVVGLLAALKLFVGQSAEEWCRPLTEAAERLAGALNALPGLRASVADDPGRPELPAVVVEVKEERLAAPALAARLLEGTPPPASGSAWRMSASCSARSACGRPTRRLSWRAFVPSWANLSTRTP